MVIARSGFLSQKQKKSKNYGALRLSYRLDIEDDKQRAFLQPIREDNAEEINEFAIQAILSQLTALDKTIVREVRAGNVYTEMSYSQLAQLLPLLARRHTIIHGERLRINNVVIKPTINTTHRNNGDLSLALGFVDLQGNWFDTRSGHIIAGNQAFFVEGSNVHPIECKAPWELALWSHHPTLAVPHTTSVQDRDKWVQRFQSVGIDDEALGSLAVHREAPSNFEVNLWADLENADDPKANLNIHAIYDGSRVQLNNIQPLKQIYIPSNDGENTRLLQRDIVAETQAIEQLRQAGFRSTPQDGVFAASGPNALRAMDPDARVFPPEWKIMFFRGSTTIF